MFAMGYLKQKEYIISDQRSLVSHTTGDYLSKLDCVAQWWTENYSCHLFKLQIYLYFILLSLFTCLHLRYFIYLYFFKPSKMKINISMRMTTFKGNIKPLSR